MRLADLIVNDPRFRRRRAYGDWEWLGSLFSAVGSTASAVATSVASENQRAAAQAEIDRQIAEADRQSRERLAREQAAASGGINIGGTSISPLVLVGGAVLLIGVVALVAGKRS